jgi:hypothetical protein
MYLNFFSGGLYAPPAPDCAIVLCKFEILRECCRFDCICFPSKSASKSTVGSIFFTKSASYVVCVDEG